MQLSIAEPAQSAELRDAFLHHLPQRLKTLLRRARAQSRGGWDINVLHLVQDELRCVPLEAIREIADLLDLSPAEVHDTMSFYGFFPQAPIGDVRVWVCRSISCMLRGGEELLAHFRLHLERHGPA